MARIKDYPHPALVRIQIPRGTLTQGQKTVSILENSTIAPYNVNLTLIP